MDTIREPANRSAFAAAVVRFLLSPEDSSLIGTAGPAAWSTGWQLGKAALWIVLAVIFALLIGQL
ncbi:MAG TPA: hypothetical protein VLT88_11005 [Desulfosarcina sp.]|nr:hypothetical protein [Desulfosarcina sp.]